MQAHSTSSITSICKLVCLGLAFGLALIAANPGVADDKKPEAQTPGTRAEQVKKGEPSTQQPGNESEKTKKDQFDGLQLKVVGVEGKVRFNSKLEVQVANLDEWRQDLKHDLKKFILQLDGNQVQFLEAPHFLNKPRQDEELRKRLNDATVKSISRLVFELKRDPRDNALWNNLIASAWDNKAQGQVLVTLSHQEADAYIDRKSFALASNALTQSPWTSAFVVTMAVAFLLFGYLAYGSDIIRAVGEWPENNDPLVPLKLKPYSLARTQMAWWYFVVLASYVWIFLVTEDLGGLTGSVLALMGISTATGLGSAIVDSERQAARKAQRTNLEKEISDIQSKIDAERRPNPETKAELETEPAKKRDELTKLDQKIRPVSVNFVHDILTDDDGISLHRFQMVGWTIALTVIFITLVTRTLTLPEFDATLLGLMGISGGAYVGFKLPTPQG